MNQPLVPEFPDDVKYLYTPPPAVDSRDVAEVVARYLNSIFRLDPTAVAELLSKRVPCNVALADHPRLVVRARAEGLSGLERPMEEGAAYDLGLVGLLNGLFSESHRLAWEVESDGRLLGFKVVDFTAR